MITAFVYWMLKFQFGKDWNMRVLLLPLAYDILGLQIGAMWLYERL